MYWFLLVFIFYFGLCLGLFIGHIQLYNYTKKEIEEYKRRERAEQLKSMNCEAEIRYLNNGNYDDLEYLEILQKQRIEKAREVVEKEN